MHNVMNRSVNATRAHIFYISMGHFVFLRLQKRKKIKKNIPDKKPPANESSSAQFEPAIKNIANRYSIPFIAVISNLKYV